MTPHGRWLIRFLPTVAAIAYFGLVASDRYVAEAQFVVRTASKPSGSVGLGALLQATGLTRSNDEIYSVQSYITSRNAAMELRKRLPIDAIYGSAKADLIARYPSVIFGPTLEELYDYLSWMISTSYSSTTGITTLQVQAFTPEDAQSVAMTLLQLGELTVNELNNRIRKDAVRVAEAEVKLAENRLVDAQVEITRFRNSEVTIDPASSLVILSELIARLGAELTKTEAQTREIAAAAATNPQLPSLQRRATAIKQQIE
ncbi:MAG: capsule biosynthesis protein, partial [Hyphomicrobium sp.]